MIATGIITQKMLAGGFCLAKIDGKNVLIEGALPNETVSVEITQDKGDFFYAKVVKIEKPSSERINATCPFYQNCGGCNFQISSVQNQRKLKEEIIKDALLRAGLSEENIPKIETIFGNEWNYRNRFQLHNGGLKRKKSNEIIKINNCPVAVNEINEYLKKNYDAENAGTAENAQNIENVKNSKSSAQNFKNAKNEKNAKNAPNANFSSNKNQRIHLFANDGNLKIAKPKEKRGKFFGSIIEENELCTVNILGKTLQFSVQGFFQSNLEMLEKTIQVLCKNLGGKRCIDFYSGVGTFSVFLAEKFEEIYLIEHNRDALVLAEKNLAQLKSQKNIAKHFSFGIAGENWHKMQDSQKDFDAVIIDPPRSGMEKSVREWLKQKKVPQIRSLSCDPVTFARDAADLCQNGYKLESLILFDYYPQTSHIESLANFVYQA